MTPQPSEPAGLRRVRIFVSSSMIELHAERRVVDEALADMGHEAWTFEDDAGARAHSIQDTYLSEVSQCDLFIGIFWKRYGERTIEEFNHARNLGKDCLVYERRDGLPEGRDRRLQDFLDRISAVETGITPRWFTVPGELGVFIKEDVARWQSEVIRTRLSGPASGRMWSRHVPVLVPARNEEAHIADTLQGILTGPGGAVAEVILIDDGSDDGTMERAREVSLLYPERIQVLSNEHPDLRKAGALLTGLEFLSTGEQPPEFVALVDADTKLEKADEKGTERDPALGRLEDWDFDACAFRVLPEETDSVLGGVGIAEYAIATDALRNLLGVVTCVSGAGSVWRRTTLMQVLGSHSGVFHGDDLETTLLAHQRDLRIIHEPRIIARTARPRSFRTFLRQRLRWDLGLMRIVTRPRFWRSTMLGRSPVSAVYRAVFLADVVMHPLKLAALVVPLLLYAGHSLNLAPPTWSAGNRLTPFESPLAKLVGVLLVFVVASGVAVKAPVRKQARFAMLGVLYVCAPYVTLIILLATIPAREVGIVVDQQYLSLSFGGEAEVFLRTVAAPFLLSLILWWVPITHLILRHASDPRQRRVGLHTILLPLYLLGHLLIVRTVAVLLAPLAGRRDYRRVGRLAELGAAVTIIGLIVAPIAIVTGHANEAHVTSATSEQWLLNSLIADGDRFYPQSYPGYRPGDFWVYDASLSTLALTTAGDTAAAAGVLRALQALQDENGSFHTAYRWVEELGRAYPLDNRVEIAPGAWVALAALQYEAATGDTTYRPIVRGSTSWLIGSLFEDTAAGSALDATMSIDTREMAVAYAALTLADQRLGLGRGASAERLERYLTEDVWDGDRGLFLERPGAEEPGSVVSQALAVMALAGGDEPGPQLRLPLDWVVNTRETTIAVPMEVGFVDVTGLSYTSEVPNLVYGEGSFQLAAAYHAIGEAGRGDAWTDRGQRMRTREGGVLYAIGTTHAEFAGRPALAPTAWYVLSRHRVNPLDRSVLLESSGPGT